MDLGAHSISLAVEDIGASKDFYEKLGFEAVMGETAHNWIIMRNGDTTIGLFQDMFDRNSITFNPGWGADATPLESFTDVRELQRQLKAKGIEPMTSVDENGTGPGSFMVIDPDGNPIIFDQHV
jgi:catechol 2,3-dioxygenase-like lactoylglutathione lyase family enzyme